METTYIPAFTLTPAKTAEAPRPSVASTGHKTPRFIDDVAAGRVELPTIPGVVRRLIVALQDPQVDSRAIVEMLSRDPVLSAKVLRVANSSFFGGQRSMASIDSAVALIGIQALNRLIMACGVATTFEAVPGIDMHTFWREALVAATAASKLAPRLSADPEQAYLCGLMHTTGHLILCRSYPEIADAMFTGFAPVRGAELAAIEIEAFGIDHPTAGALWIESLGFPQEVAEAIRKTAWPLANVHVSLDVAVCSGCALGAAIARGDGADAALAVLPPGLHSGFSMPNGKADAAFARLHALLLETRPPL
jgi:HD-like signal output (HDOD) protein